MRLRPAFLIISLLLLTGTCLQAGTLLPSEVKAVVISSPRTQLQEETLQLLLAGWQKLFGFSLSVQDFPATKEGCLFLGEAAVKAGLIQPAELKKVWPGGHVIKTAKKSVAICGNTNWDTYYGVINYLKHLGLRYYLPEGQAVISGKIPSRLPGFFLLEKPVFACRAGWSSLLLQTTRELGDPRKGLNEELFDPQKTGSDLWIDHSAGYLVPKLLYYDQHPEYYALCKDGKRVAKDAFTDHRTPLCLSNQEVVRISSARALGWIEKQPDKNFFTITYGDTGLWCQCSECLKLDPIAGQYSSRLLSWVNSVARCVRQHYPEKIILTFAYGGTDEPPPKIRPEKNVWIVGSTGLGNIPFWDHALKTKEEKMQRHLRKLNGWLKVAAGRYLVCEYLSGVYEPALIDNLTARLRYYARKGLKGIVFTYGHPINFTRVWTYVFSWMMWNPYQDPWVLTADFCRFYYGAASGAVTSFFQVCHERYLQTLRGRVVLNRLYPEGYYSPEFVEKALACLQNAKTLLSEEKKRKEIENEERLFLLDWLAHPLEKSFNESARKTLARQLEQLLLLSGETEGEKIQFARDIHRVAVVLNSVLPGSLAYVENWLKSQQLPKPKAQVTSSEVRLPAEVFLYAGFGPARYGENCPPKTAVAIYVEGNSRHLSSHMEAEFTLEEVPGSGSSILEVEGQDCDHDVPAACIRILINNQTIFEGPVSLVKKNWSRQSFSIPPGVLKKGSNTISFVNTGAPDSINNWFERWFMLSEAVIRFSQKAN